VLETMKFRKRRVVTGKSGHIGQNISISAFRHSEDREDKELDIRTCEVANSEIPFSGKGRGHILKAVWKERTRGSNLFKGF
jgi:hypothetical protein